MLATSFEWYFMKDMYEKLGFPHLEDGDYPDCGVTGLNEACDRDREFLCAFRDEIAGRSC